MPVAGPEHSGLPRDLACPPACLDSGMCVRACGGSLVDEMEEEFECRYCGNVIRASECVSWDMHCQGCKDVGNCRSCNGAPSVKP
jgi:hypothetical protein